MMLVLIFCVGISQVIVIAVMAFYIAKPVSNNNKKLAEVKKTGCNKIKNMAATLHKYQQQVLVSPTAKKSADEERPLVWKIIGFDITSKI